MEKNGFCAVYPFATENVKGCFNSLDVKDKTVLTVGSSLDQAFNAITMGAKKITVLDINPNAFEFFNLKKKIILSTERKKLYDVMTDEKTLKKHTTSDISLSKDVLSKKQVLSINDYLESDEKYNLLRKKLETAPIEFVTGDIFKMDEVLDNIKYDRIILSNILQYIEYFYKDKNPYEVLNESMQMWDKYLTDNGILQLLYLYSFNYSDALRKDYSIATYNLRKVYEALKKYQLEVSFIDGIVSKDAVVTCMKRKAI